MKTVACAFLACVMALPASSEDVPQNAIRLFRLRTKQIQECPQSLASERRWGSKPNEIERWYFGSPISVVWDVVPSKTPVRSPFEAYVEFSASYSHWIPPEVKAKYDSMNFAPAIFLLYNHKFRYEFDVSPEEVALTRALQQHSQGSREWDDFDRRDFCWDKVLRATQQDH
jgi:hypothetical protein